MDEPADFATVLMTRGPSVTIAQITIADERDTSRTFVGESKRHRNDSHDQLIGDSYAVARALQAAVDYLTVEADLRVARSS